MMKTIAVLPLDGGGVLGQFQYSIFVATLGYEQRARFIAEHWGHAARYKVASAFDSRKEHSYEKNAHWFTAHGYEIVETSDEAFLSHCRAVLKRLDDRNARIAIDISSMSRFRMAAWVAAILEHANVAPIEVDFLYAPADFSEPPHESAPIVISQPVMDIFAGWSDEPDRPTAAIFGLGYEYDKAVGTLEYLEPANVWAFRPQGTDARYEHELERANFTLWDLIPKDRVITYGVHRPYECFLLLESLTAGALEHARPVLIPFGPKIFSLCCLLVAAIHHPYACVWRVSSGPFEAPLERIASGPIVGLKTRFGY